MQRRARHAESQQAPPACTRGASGQVVQQPAHVRAAQQVVQAAAQLPRRRGLAGHRHPPVRPRSRYGDVRGREDLRRRPHRRRRRRLRRVSHHVSLLPGTERSERQNCGPAHAAARPLGHLGLHRRHMPAGRQDMLVTLQMLSELPTIRTVPVISSREVTLGARSRM